MNPAELLPILELVKDRDQSRLIELRLKIASIEAERENLSQQKSTRTRNAFSLEQLRTFEMHNAWIEREHERLIKQEQDLHPEIEAAKASFKTSFGRLEAMRQIALGNF